MTAPRIEFRLSDIDTGVRIEFREPIPGHRQPQPWHHVADAADDEHAERLIGRHAMMIMGMYR